MAQVILALIRAIASLAQPQVWRFIALPAALSFILWIALAIWGVGALIDWLLTFPPMTLLTAWGLLWLAQVLAWVGGWMLLFALVYLSTALFAAVLVLPALLGHVARRDYADLAPLGRDSLIAGAVNSTLASVLFLAGWLLTIPLWLVPGLSFLLPLLLMAWLNRRSFAYDALSVHATPEEWRQIRQQERGGLFLLGLALAVLAHVPILGLFVPAFAALAYIHYTLEALRRLRGDDVIIGEARVIAVE